jgi:predicted nucleic acid-binding protein
MKKTYIDSGVLIDAIRGNDANAQKAIAILDDPEREFISSIFVRLEVLPKAIHHRNQHEVEFYETFFHSVKYWADSLNDIVELAYQEATTYGLNAIDSLHVASALSSNADELITSEKVTSLIHKTKSIKIVSIRS